MKDTSASGRWTLLDGLRRQYLTRAERHARFTLPRMCPPENYSSNNDSLNYDWHSVGAQAANHIINRLMLTLFAPSRPFMRLDMATTDKAELLANLRAQESDFEEWMAAGERDAMKELDNRPVRTHLFDVFGGLVVVGDTLLYLPRDHPEAVTTYGIREYVIRRTPGGRLAELIVRQLVALEDLDPDALAAYHSAGHYADPDATVTLYHHVRRTGKDALIHEQWVESVKLPEKFTSTYTDETSPWVPLAWNLKRGQHYGTGLVEDYSGDFAALSSLAQAEVEGALLASEFRWLVNPGGATKIDDLRNSKNGDAIPGLEGDVVLVSNSKPQDLQVVSAAAESRIRRIGQGFLMPSAMTRDSERTTATEIRLQAQELETGLGGAYTRLASNLQPAVARWLLHLADLQIQGTKVRLSIITGLDALSRNGDLAALRAALTDVAGLNQLGPVTGELNLAAVISEIFLGHGLNPKKYVKSAAVKQQEQAAAEGAAARQAGTDAAATAAAQTA